MAAHSNILTWEIPWTDETGSLQFRGSKELDTTLRLNKSTNSSRGARAAPDISDPLLQPPTPSPLSPEGARTFSEFSAAQWGRSELTFFSL